MKFPSNLPVRPQKLVSAATQMDRPRVAVEAKTSCTASPFPTSKQIELNVATVTEPVVLWLQRGVGSFPFRALYQHQTPKLHRTRLLEAKWAHGEGYSHAYSPGGVWTARALAFGPPSKGPSTRLFMDSSHTPE